jgi:hypothetical protein
MAFNYTKIGDYLFGNFYGHQSFKKVNDNNRYLAEDLFGDPANNSNNVNMALSDVTLSKEIKGSRFAFTFWGGIPATDDYLAFDHVAPRGGSIVGAAIQAYTLAFTSARIVTPIVRINGVDVLSLSSLNINANNTEFKTSTTQARNVDTFLANDTIQFFIDVTTAGTLTARVLANIEVVLNT